MKQKRHATTFIKLTAAFVGFGLVPLLLLSFLFVFRFNGIIQENVVASYRTMNGYVTRGVGDVLHNVDAAMGELYDYHDEAGRSFSEILRDVSLDQSEREQDVRGALEHVMMKSPYISSMRISDARGNLYSRYNSLDKVMKYDAASHTSMDFYEDKDLTDLLVLGTLPEGELSINSEEYIFCLLRNYMDTSTVANASSKVLAAMYADVNVLVIEDIVKKAGLGQENYYVVNMKEHRYLYSSDKADYLDGAHPLVFCEDKLKGQKGYARIGSRWVFFEKIDAMDVYGVLVMDHERIVGDLFQSRAILILILCFSCCFLLILYMAFSIRMSQPTRILKEAMEEVEQGNLDARVNIDTNDEMAYVADGFNKMTERLRAYIKEAYIAQLAKKDAELNALKMQIKPHYLYNTLDIIRMTALDQDDQKTARLLESLASQLRYVMGEHTDRVVLREELDAIREYFVIMKVRYEDRITLMISVDDKDCELLVPKLLLQPFVENAIKHGLREREGYGAVAISVVRKETYLEITVMDDGVGMSEETLQKMQERLESPGVDQLDREGQLSIGMKNVYDRIKLDCGEEYGYSLQSTLGVGTIVTCRLPIWTE